MTNALDAAHRSLVGAGTVTTVNDQREPLQTSPVLLGLTTQSTRARCIQWIAVRVVRGAFAGRRTFTCGVGLPH